MAGPTLSWALESGQIEVRAEMIRSNALFPTVALALLLASGSAQASNPPICPHVIDWNGAIGTWAQGATWIKVLFSTHISSAHACGAKVFYRPYDADSYSHDDGCLPSNQTGAQYADMVWARISSISPKPEAVSYRNEFDWSDPPNCKRTCVEFINYKNRLRTNGYTGKIIFSSFGQGWVDSSTWNDPDLTAAVNASDGVETHEYFDLVVTCCAPWLCFRHRDIAIANHPYLQSKDWYIGEFGSGSVCGVCDSCADPQCRNGWQDRNKLNAQQYIDQIAAYRSGCANQVVAVFLFAQGSQAWWDFEVVGTGVADYMKTTWTAQPGAISGTVRNTSGQNISGATVTLSPGGQAALSGSNGAYAIGSVTAGSYSVTAARSGYGPVTQTGKTVSSGQTTTVNFTLVPISPISTAKGLSDGVTAALDGIVTARFPVGGTQSQIYIEDANRVSGIAISTTTAVNVGDEVQCQGTMTTTSGERVLTAASVVTVQSPGSPPKKLGVNNRALGGGQFGLQPAVLNRSSVSEHAKGPNNIGLLVRMWGKLTYLDPAGAFFYLDDGSAISDGFGQTGIRVACSNLPVPTSGANVTVTGISCATQINSKTVRLLRPRSAGDLSYVTTTNLLANPGFETGNQSGWTTVGVSGGVQCTKWFADIVAHTGTCYNGLAVNGGTASGYLYQQVAVTAGLAHTASVWSAVYWADNSSSSTRNRIGIDPTGGTGSPSASTVWNAWDVQSSASTWAWRQLTVSATPTTSHATVYLQMDQQTAAGWHINCFDDASLSLAP